MHRLAQLEQCLCNHDYLCLVEDLGELSKWLMRVLYVIRHQMDLPLSNETLRWLDDIDVVYRGHELGSLHHL